MNESRDQKRFYENYTKVLEAIKSYNIALYHALKVSLENQIGMIDVIGDMLKPPYTMMKKLKNVTMHSFEDLEAKTEKLDAIISMVLKDLELESP